MNNMAKSAKSGVRDQFVISSKGSSGFFARRREFSVCGDGCQNIPVHLTRLTLGLYLCFALESELMCGLHIAVRHFGAAG